jgi:hypothetical protein
MRKRNTPIRMITVRPAQPRTRAMLALARRFGLVRRAPALPGGETQPEGLDLDQRVRAVGEW